MQNQQKNNQYMLLATFLAGLLLGNKPANKTNEDENSVINTENEFVNNKFFTDHVKISEGDPKQPTFFVGTWLPKDRDNGKLVYTVGYGITSIKGVPVKKGSRYSMQDINDAFIDHVREKTKIAMNQIGIEKWKTYTDRQKMYFVAFCFQYGMLRTSNLNYVRKKLPPGVKELKTWAGLLFPLFQNEKNNSRLLPQVKSIQIRLDYPNRNWQLFS